MRLQRHPQRPLQKCRRRSPRRHGKNEAADIRVGDKTAAAVRVKAEAPAAPADGVAAPAAETPAGPLKSEDGSAMLSGSGKQINLKLADKGAQTCKSN